MTTIVETFAAPEVWADGGVIRSDGINIHVLLFARQFTSEGVLLVEAGRLRMPIEGFAAMERMLTH